MSKRKPRGYWKDFDNVRSALEEVTEKLDHFPSQKEINEQFGGLAGSIYKHHGSLADVQKLLGIQANTRPRSYWKDFDNVKAELEVMLQRLGHLPTLKEIKALSGFGFEVGVYKYHGGFASVKEKLGYATKSPDWTNPDNIRSLIKENKWSSLPSENELVNLGYGKLAKIVRRCYGGYPALREVLGEKRKRTPDGHWKDFENVRAELDKLIAKIGHFPTQKELKGQECTGLLTGIQKYHGGMSGLKKRAGYELERKPPKYWREWNNVEREIEHIKKKHGFAELPQAEVLYSLGYAGLSTAISTLHGGFFKARARLGTTQKQVPVNAWADLEFTIDKATQFMSERNYAALPTCEVLWTAGHSSLSYAISRYHGGFANFRNILAQRTGQPTEKEQLETILDTYSGDSHE